MKSLTGIVAGLAVLLTANVALGDTWRVESRVADGERIVVEPVFIMSADESASLEMEGARGFRYALTLEPFGDSVRLTAHFEEGSIVLDPEIVTRPGESVTLDIDDYTFTMRATPVEQ